MPKRSIIIIIIFVISAIGMAFLSWHAWPQQNLPESSQDRSNISGWNTYRNEELGFEMNYPNKWAIQPSNENNFLVELKCCNDFSLSYVVVWVAPFTSLSIEDYLNELRTSIESEELSEKFKPFIDIIEIHGVKAIKKTQPKAILGVREAYLYIPLVDKDKMIIIAGHIITDYIGDIDNTPTNIEVPQSTQDRLYREIIEMQNSVKITL